MSARQEGTLSWPRFLLGEDPLEIHAHLCNGDPLRLCEGSARRLKEAWFLLEPDRVYHRALGVCAEAAAAEAPPRDISEWVREKIDLAIEQLVTEDREAERLHPESLSEEDKHFPLLTQCLYIEPELVRRCTVAFNRLNALPRRAFYELLLDGREVAECIEAGPWDEDGMYEAIQTALAAFNLDVRSGSREREEDEGEYGRKTP